MYRRPYVTGFAIGQSRVHDTSFLLVQRAQDLISATFAAIATNVQQPIRNCMVAAAQAVPDPPGSYLAPSWPEVHVMLDSNAEHGEQRKRQRVSHGGGRDTGTGNSLAEGAMVHEGLIMHTGYLVSA